MMRILVGAIAFTLVGALIGAGIGWLGNPKPVEVPDQELGFINYVGPIIGGSVGGTLGLIFGGGWVAKFVVGRRDAGRGD